MTLHDEFVFGILGIRKTFRIEDLDYYDDILIAENQKFWNNVQRGYVLVFMQKPKRFQAEPEPVLVGKLPVNDAIKKFG